MRPPNFPSFSGENGLFSNSSSQQENFQNTLWDTRKRDTIDYTNIAKLLREIAMYNDSLKTENALLISTEMDKIYSIVKGVSKTLENDNFNSEMLRIKHRITELNHRYNTEFNKFSHIFENWAVKRRRTLKKLDDAILSLSRTELYCNVGRFVLSSFSFATAIGSITLSNININWSIKMFFAATSAGSTSFICYLIEVFNSKSHIESVLKALHEDLKCFESLETSIRYSSVDEEIFDLFPYGVDKRIAMGLAEEPYFTSMTSNYPKESSSLKYSSPLNTQEQICFAILLSNVLIDSDLLKDEEFIYKVRAFSKSSIAVKLWNRLTYKHSKNYIEKMKLDKQLMSYLKHDLLSFPFLSLVTLPIYSNNYLLPVLCTAILNGLVSFETYCELFISYPSNESTTLTRLKTILRKQYKELNRIYDVLNPHND